MYFYLTGALKRRLILELQDSFARHPVYKKIVDQIVNRTGAGARPQNGIVVKGVSGNKLAFSADNYIGRVVSRTMLANVGEPRFPLEWVREDLQAIQANGGVLPTPPGVYYLEILQAPDAAQDAGSFVIDPLITVSDEPVVRYDSGLESGAQLQQVPAQGTLRLWENGKFLLREGVHYRLDRAEIQLLAPLSRNSVLTADYNYPVASVGPIPFHWNTADFSTLPGVVLAFGKRAAVGDRIAIVVYPEQVETANAHGGKFEASFDLQVLAQDPIQAEEIADLTFMYLWTEKRSSLSSEGLEITDVTMGGEADEMYDETSDIPYFAASLTVNIQADWEIHLPLPLTVSRVTATTAAMDDASSPADTKALSTIVGDVQSKLFLSTAPVLIGKSYNFERIR